MAATAADSTESRFMQCMEIWGGNRAANSAVSIHGIDAWVFSEPYAGHTSGGDIHYVSMCGGGNIGRFVVADVAGHGSAVGEMAVNLRSLMAKHINRVDQTQFVRALNQEFARLGQAGTFATALLATYHAPTDRLITCNAGHPTPLWYRMDKRTWQWLEHDVPDRLESASNLPLGVIHPTHYHQFAVGLAKGDLILIYTDSLIEAKSPQGRQLGEKGLLDLVHRLDVQRPGQFCPDLLESVRVYRGEATLEDDVTVLLLHHNAADPPPHSLGEWAKVIAKMTGLIKV